jgi:release factor glutamine methyltransferase
MVTTKIYSVHINTKNLLKRAGIADYRFEAAVLFEHFTGLKAHEIVTMSDKNVDAKAVEGLKKAVEKRISGYPLQYIVGMWEFYGYPVYVGEGVLIPRQDTEALVEAVIEAAGEAPVIADLCSGSGCIAIALEKEIPNSKVYAVEKSEEALSYLNKNIKLNSSKIKLIRGDVLDSDVLENFGLIDIIVSNPPYITGEAMKSLQKEVTYEPEIALDGGVDGLYFYRGITVLWKNKLKKNGILAYEVGIDQEFDVAEILTQNGFSEVEFKKDFSGITRVVYGKLTKI